MPIACKSFKQTLFTEYTDNLITELVNLSWS